MPTRSPVLAHRASSTRIVLVAALALLVLPATLPAQDAVLAQKTLKAAAKQAVAEMGPDLKAAVATAKKALADFDKEVANGNFDVGLLIGLDDALVGFMGAVAHEVEQAHAKLVNGLGDGLAAGGGSWGGSLPDGFLPGDASTLDDTRAAIVKKAASSIAQVGKRLDSSSKKLQKKEGLPLLYRMEVPPLPQLAVSDIGSGGWIAPMSIDLAVSCSGLILFGGHAALEISETLTVEVYDIFGSLPALTQSAGLAADQVTGRYSALVANSTTLSPFAPGIYNLKVSQPFGFSALAQIGVR